VWHCQKRDLHPAAGTRGSWSPGIFSEWRQRLKCRACRSLRRCRGSKPRPLVKSSLRGLFPKAVCGESCSKGPDRRARGVHARGIRPEGRACGSVPRQSCGQPRCSSWQTLYSMHQGMFSLLLNIAPPFLLWPEALGPLSTSGPRQDSAVYSGQRRHRPLHSSSLC